MTDPHTQRTIQAPFEITDCDETAYEEPVEGPKLTRVPIRKHYQGPLEAPASRRCQRKPLSFRIKLEQIVPFKIRYALFMEKGTTLGTAAAPLSGPRPLGRRWPHEQPVLVDLAV